VDHGLDPVFIRFVIPVYRHDSRAEAGFFYWAYWVRDRNGYAPLWIRQELARELFWFDSNLPVPDRFTRKFRRRRTIHGICWFRQEAGECVSRARYVGWLMTEAGAPVDEIRIDEPGEVIYRDNYQIVAKAPRNLVRAFH
jgi:hypothetical protein